MGSARRIPVMPWRPGAGSGLPSFVRMRTWSVVAGQAESLIVGTPKWVALMSIE